MVLLSVPLKKASEVDLIKPLSNFIKGSYNNKGCENMHDQSIIAFNKQRNTAISKIFDKNETSLETLYDYFDQLCFLEPKISVNELQIPFKWKNAFDKGSIFGNRISLTHTCLAYEKVCILFNVAALQSAVAASQGSNSDENLKKSAKLFQQSAGVFEFLKSMIATAIPSEPTTDLNPETLTVLSLLMLAQAQEVFIIKAIKDNLKDTIIAKLCCKAEEFYSEVLQETQKESLRNLWDKEWIPNIASKQVGFHAMSEFYQSLVCRAEKKIGEEISRLQYAIELFETAYSRLDGNVFFEDYAKRSKLNLVESKKDNDFIYNEMIPDFKSLQSVQKLQLVKPIPVILPLKSNTEDLFKKLVPLAVDHAILASEIRKNEIINMEITKLRQGTQKINAVLARLNLPAAVDSKDTEFGLPLSLLEKANDIKQKGGFVRINTFIKDLPELLKRNREILDETERMLNEERESDNLLRFQFKEKWTRIPSDKLTEMFRANCKTYRDILCNAVDADKIVKQKFEKHTKEFELLSMDLDQIKNAIPFTGGSVDEKTESVQKLQSLMKSVVTIKLERDVIETELKTITINLKEEFLKSFYQNGTVNEPLISADIIEKIIAPMRSRVLESISCQETLISEIEKSHAQFVIEAGKSGGTQETLLSELATAYDCFIELQNNLQEGTKFYNDLTQLLLVFQNKITDFCFARKTEKEELLKDLTTESSRQNPGLPPNIPCHHADANPEHFPVAPLFGNIPYPSTVQGMPMPFGVGTNVSFRTFAPPPLPQGYSPYVTLPYPNGGIYAGFPQAQNSNNGTYPGSFDGRYQKQKNPPDC